MDREKRINKLAVEVYENTSDGFCDFTAAINIAQYLYNTGYRKQSDTAEEIFEEVEKILSKNLTWTKDGATLCYSADKVDDQLAELKKKYIEKQ